MYLKEQALDVWPSWRMRGAIWLLLKPIPFSQMNGMGDSSFPRRRGLSVFPGLWIPAFAVMRSLELLSRAAAFEQLQYATERHVQIDLSWSACALSQNRLNLFKRLFAAVARLQSGVEASLLATIEQWLASL